MFFKRVTVRFSRNLDAVSECIRVKSSQVEIERVYYSGWTVDTKITILKSVVNCNSV